MQVHSIGGKLSLEVFIRGPRSWTPKMFRLVVLWVWIIAAVVTALDEREFDPQVAPPQSLGNFQNPFNSGEVSLVKCV
ncbi:uncharacterized protein LOC108106294 isoform X2 [Drosophila eugracilis]|uniref:uncharacterized protein LOC108106294 isoform X2 n=1 Tax=Drosophila eugracilis TaxID=29029 RepID=UPI0007E6133C|nr:uncharacterized protein LOC108106294 isoform X2 [Drosophila eugracilis]